ncbi:MAG TPA: biopolymer transporter ExbD [Candidatus Fermentibacter sp.]|nr:biopolymer transporter ExbD [Candidatus Fermentibacter sp.]
MLIQRRIRAAAKVYTGSSADLVFILIIFFMSTTLFKEEGGMSIRFPQAHPEVMTEIGKQSLSIKVWIKQITPGDPSSDLVARIGDFDMPVSDVPTQLRTLSERLWREQNKSVDVIVFNVDQRVPMGDMVELFNALRYEELYSVMFNADEQYY